MPVPDSKENLLSFVQDSQHMKKSKLVLNSSSDLLTTLDCTDSLDHAKSSTDLDTKTTKTVINGILGKQ